MVSDLSGIRFGEWFVLRKVASRHNSSYYLCHCVCGNERHVRRHHLTSGASKSCGCLLSKTSKPRLANANKVFRNGYSDGDLSFDEFLSLSQQSCYYCGIGPSNISNRYKYSSTKSKSNFVVDNGDFCYNGLDRKDSSLPHNKDNVVPCCATCNYAKNIMNVSEFKNWIKRVYLHLFNKVENSEMLQRLDKKLECDKI